MANQNPTWEHAEDKCDECGGVQDCWRGHYPDEGYDYLTWVCRNCGHVDDRHEYHAETA